MARTKADYEKVARDLAYSLAIKLGTTGRVEGWLATLDEIKGCDFERELLADAWERLRASRISQGVCPDCDRRTGHDAECPQHTEAES